jgi:hypothetical protein
VYERENVCDLNGWVVGIRGGVSVCDTDEEKKIAKKRSKSEERKNKLLSIITPSNRDISCTDEKENTHNQDHRKGIFFLAQARTLSLLEAIDWDYVVVP